ncbi:MAG: hypothetical protein GXY23_05250 [Myxococcales bacterium]|nr:hypothetical protein [Myxococcales bacterium]
MPSTATDAPRFVLAELALAQYLGRDFRGQDHRAALLGLPLVLDFIVLDREPREFDWGDFDPHAYVRAIRDLEDTEALFLRALLRETSLFFGYLAERDELPRARARRVRAEIERALAELEGVAEPPGPAAS